MIEAQLLILITPLAVAFALGDLLHYTLKALLK